MRITFSSLITTLLFSSISIVLLSIILKNNVVIKKAGVRVLLFSVAISALHLLIPYEFAFTKTIAVSEIWPQAYLFLNRGLFMIFSTPISLVNLLFLAWIAGAVYCIAKKTRSYIGVSKAVNRLAALQRASHSDIKCIAASVAKQYARGKKFHVVISSAVSAPMVFGVFRPVIILPHVILDEKEWRYILSHEIAHYYHGDLLTAAI